MDINDCDNCTYPEDWSEAADKVHELNTLLAERDAEIESLNRQLDSFRESTKSDWDRINKLMEEQSSWSFEAVKQFNRADDLERQLSASQQQVAELQLEVERLKHPLVSACASFENGKKQAAMEVLQLLDAADWACSTYEETYYQSVAAIKSKFGLEG